MLHLPHVVDVEIALLKDLLQGRDALGILLWNVILNDSQRTALLLPIHFLGHSLLDLLLRFFLA